LIAADEDGESVSIISEGVGIIAEHVIGFFCWMTKITDKLVVATFSILLPLSKKITNANFVARVATLEGFFFDFHVAIFCVLRKCCRIHSLMKSMLPSRK